ncbi:hypothetical protein Vretifemale_11490 [Volvox reticuliferus]|uniref:Uncharacterized protein n=1 Tax=Volvox reticuliferus TaxID=1737510 RepID=A0A8J4FSK5_9CHLO|nr:hypothetical protein Vretifemale_11490 [Volvox reticuliferus]
MWRRRATEASDVAKEACHDCPTAKQRAPTRPTLRELRDTLITAVNQAILPIPILTTPDYSRYLTEQVAGYTLGWQIFRAAAETNYLLYHGWGIETVVVQIFLACSISSVFLCLLRRQLWLRWREHICIGMNCTYGIVTFLKAFHLVPRLPNETHYLFKHCLLSLADAFFCQVPVHKFYHAQAVDASLRCVVWRRYNVLPGAPLPVVVVVSLTWQAWIVVFSSMLQARHVTAYQQRSLLQAQTQAQAAEQATAAKAVGLTYGSSNVDTAVAGGSSWGGADMPRPPSYTSIGGPQEEQQPYRSEQRPLGLASGSTATTMTASDLGAETSSPGALPPSDILLSHFSSSSTRTRSGLSSVARLPYRVIAHGSIDADITHTASMEEEGQPLSSGEERGRSTCDVGASYSLVQEARRGSSTGDECNEGGYSGLGDGDDDAFRAPIPMLSIVESMDGSSERLSELEMKALPLQKEAWEISGHTEARDEVPSGAITSGTVATISTVAAVAAAAADVCSTATAATPVAAAATTTRHCSSRQVASVDDLLQDMAAATAAAAAAGFDVPSRAAASANRRPSVPPRLVPVPSLHGSGLGSGGSRYSRQSETALRRLVEGPSSYVLLSKQRERDQNSRASTSVQLVVSSASPCHMVAQWREKLAVALAERGSGWHLANVSVRKGSLIVHLDLVYHPAPASTTTADAAGTGAGTAAAAGSSSTAATAFAAAADSGNSSSRWNGGMWSEAAAAPADASAVADLLSSGAATDIPLPSLPPLTATESLERFFVSLGPSGVLDALSLAGHMPTSSDDFISVQHGNRMLQYGCDTVSARYAAPVVLPAPWPRGEIGVALPESSGPAGSESGSGDGGDGRCGGSTTPVRLRLRRGAQAAAQSLQARLRGCSEDERGSLRRRLLGRGRSVGGGLARAIRPLIDTTRRRVVALYDNVLLALRPPPLLAGRDYAAFLTTRVAVLHIAYTNLMVATMLTFYAFHRGVGLRLTNILAYLAPELLTVAARSIVGSAIWAASREPLVHAGVAVDDCTEMRWIMKMMLISALQVICMQTPVRLTFAVRLLPLLGVILSHVLLCHPEEPLLWCFALHLGWEAALFLLAAYMQGRHIEAYRRHRLSSAGASTASLSPSVQLSPSGSCFSFTDAASVVSAKTIGTSCEDVHSCKSLSSTAAAAATAAVAGAINSSDGGNSSTIAGFLSAAPSDKSPPTPVSCSGGNASPSVELLWSAMAKWEDAGEASEAGANDADPWEVTLDRCVLAMAPRRTSLLHLSFTCTSRVVEELQVVLRHISPASMASGVHSASSATAITRTLAPPAAAHVQQPHGSALRFEAKLIMVASPQDTPGIVHVELWRGHRRLVGRPVLLALAQPPPALIETDGSCKVGAGPQAAMAVDAATSVAAEGDLPAWMSDVAAYVEAVAAEGHTSAADQFVEELGGWLAQLAALERGLTSAPSGAGAHPAGVASTNRIARVLRVHSAAWVPPPAAPEPTPGLRPGGSYGAAARPPPRHQRPSCGCPESAGAATTELSETPQSVLDPTISAIRQLLLCQGQGLLAVAVEAGCKALSEHLLSLLLGALGSGLPAVLEAAVTPVTGLPLMHAAVKSGCTQMVDMVAGWQIRAGITDFWSREAVVRAISLEPRLQPGTSAATNLTSPNVMTTAVVNTAWAPPQALPCAPAAVTIASPTVAAVAPPVPPAQPEPEQQQQLLILTHCESMIESAATAAEVGRDADTLEMGFPTGHNDKGLSLTGSFLLETGRQSPPQSVSNMPAALLATVAFPSVLPPAGPQPSSVAALTSQRLSPPKLLWPPPEGSAAAAAPYATAYTTTGVSMVAAAAAEELAPAQGHQPIAELSAPFKVVSFRPETAGASSAVQVLPRDACDSKEPAAAGGLLPHVLYDPRVISTAHGGASEISAAMSQKAVFLSTAAAPLPLPPAGLMDMEPRRLQAASLARGGVGTGRDSAPQRSSLESQWAFVDGGVLLLTPLHLALALGDEGRVAAHIFAKYHEAHDLWSASQAQWLATGASNAASAMDSNTMHNPFEMPPAFSFGGGGPSSSYAGFAGPLMPSGIAQRRGSSVATATATSAAVAMQSHASHARHRMSGVGGWVGSTLTGGAYGGGGGAGGERTTPRGWLRMSSRALRGCEEGVQGYGGGTAQPPLLGAIQDVGPEGEAVQSLSLAKLAFMEAMRRTVQGGSVQGPASPLEEKGCSGGSAKQM